MKVYICTHDGVWITGYSVVVAKDRPQAKRVIKRKLQEVGLDPEQPFSLDEVNTSEPNAVVVFNGDY